MSPASTAASIRSNAAGNASGSAVAWSGRSPVLTGLPGLTAVLPLEWALDALQVPGRPPERQPATGGASIPKSTTHERFGRADLAFTLNTLAGRYHVVDRAAAGGMGEVFLSHDAVLDRRVAIKVLHRNLAATPLRRALPARGQGRRQPQPPEHRRRPRLGLGRRHLLHGDGVRRGPERPRDPERGGLLRPRRRPDVLSQTLAALGHAHRQGIVDRDMKPENLMVTRDGDVKVADFGLARAYADAQITEAGTVTGTVQYLSPE